MIIFLFACKTEPDKKDDATIEEIEALEKVSSPKQLEQINKLTNSINIKNDDEIDFDITNVHTIIDGKSLTLRYLKKSVAGFLYIRTM